MDNLEQNTSPLGEADVTASQGQLDATETQPVENEVSIDGGNSEETGQASNPWDNDPKFKGKTSEDIYKAYKESEKLTGQLSQKAQIANLIQEKYGITPEQLKAQIEQQEAQQRQQYYANNPLAPVLDKVSYLEQRLQQQEQEKAMASVEKEIDSFLKDNPVYEGSRDKIQKLALTPNIGFNLETGEEVPIDELAREWIGESRAQGQQDAYNKIEKKVLTQATSASQTAPRGRITEDDLANMSAAEMEAILPHADMSNRLH
jgi:hypothetical protein